MADLHFAPTETARQRSPLRKPETRPVQTDTPPPKDQVKKDVLDELAGRSKAQTQRTDPTDNTQAGEAGDA